MASVTPTAGGPSSGFRLQSLIPQNLGSTLETGTVLGQLGNSGYAALKGGEATVGDAGTIINDVKSFHIFDGGLFTAIKGIGASAIKFGATSGLVQGGLSLLINGYRAFNHEISFAQAGSRVVGDTATGVVGGMAATVASGLGMAAITTFLGLTGGVVTVLGAVIGMGAYYLAEKMFKGSNLYQKIRAGASSIFGQATTPLMAGG